MENGEKSLRRFFDILEYIASGRTGRSVKEIAGALEIPESTVYRMLKFLTAYGYTERSSEGILLGRSCLALGAMAQEQNLLQRVARTELLKLAGATGETVHLARLQGAEILFLDKVDGIGSIRMGSMIGKSAPLHCSGLGKAMLAALPEKELDEYLKLIQYQPFTGNTLITPESLRADLIQCRQRGYAIDDCEHEPGVYCVSSAIVNRKGKLFAGISVSGLDIKLKPATETLAEQVRSAARAIGQLL